MILMKFETYRRLILSWRNQQSSLLISKKTVVTTTGQNVVESPSWPEGRLRDIDCSASGIPVFVKILRNSKLRLKKS